MPTEPQLKRTIAFIDGQNLFYATKNAFGYDHPSYDPQALAKAVCEIKHWSLQEIHFYTIFLPRFSVVPKKQDDDLFLKIAMFQKNNPALPTGIEPVLRP